MLAVLLVTPDWHLLRSRQGPYMSFSDHLNRFDPLNHRPRRLLRPRPLHRTQPSFDVAMIGFDAVVSILATAVAATGTDLTFRFQLGDRCRIAAIAVNGQHVWWTVVRIRQRRLQEPLRGFAISGFRQIKVDRLSATIHGAEQIHPVARDGGRQLFIPTPYQVMSDRTCNTSREGSRARDLVPAAKPACANSPVSGG